MTNQLLALDHDMLSEAKLRALAREIALNLFELDVVLERLGFTSVQWMAISARKEFRRMVSEARDEWGSSMSTPGRVKMKSLALLEEKALPGCYKMLEDPHVSPAAKTDIVKTLAKMAGIGEREGVVANEGGKLIVEINMGADSKLRYEKEPPMIDGEATEIGNAA